MKRCYIVFLIQLGCESLYQTVFPSIFTVWLLRLGRENDHIATLFFHLLPSVNETGEKRTIFAIGVSFGVF